MTRARRSRRWGAGLAVATLLTAAAPSPTSARSDRTVGWAPDRVFPTAVRFLRVDESLTIVDKDSDAGYILFELVEDDKTFRGSLELVAVDRDPPRARVVIHIEDRPAYMEVGMLDRLERKLRDELGPPPRRPQPAPSRPDGA
jgi:hypothetical protein